MGNCINRTKHNEETNENSYRVRRQVRCRQINLSRVQPNTTRIMVNYQGNNQDLSSIIATYILETSITDENRGIPQETLSSFHEIVINNNTNKDSCPICLSHYKNNQICRTLPCTHYYHKETYVDLSLSLNDFELFLHELLVTASFVPVIASGAQQL